MEDRERTKFFEFEVAVNRLHCLAGIEVVVPGVKSYRIVVSEVRLSLQFASHALHCCRKGQGLRGFGDVLMNRGDWTGPWSFLHLWDVKRKSRWMSLV